MKVPVSWLQEYIAAPLPLAATAERLTRSGIEVESLDGVGALDPKVVVAEVKSLSELKPGTLRVEFAADRARTVVSNAPGLAVGKKLALALPGATLFAADLSGLESVREADLFGVHSEGVVANEATLGIGEDATTPVFVEANVGEAIASVLGERAAGGDEVMLLAILPNIARCQSLSGVAREVTALMGLPLKSPAAPPALTPSGKLTPTIDAPDAANVLALTLLENVRVTESPRWLKRRLVLAGMTPINNVVDASNYVMLELGEPTHPYDADKLPSLDLGVRRTRAGERLLTLQQNEAEEPQQLPAGVPVIVSGEVPVAVAGVIGGRPSSIGATTTRVLLEAAAFDFTAIRRSQQAIKVYTEASARFSRGVNPDLPALASRRFVDVLRETSPELRVVSAGECVTSRVSEREIELTLEELNGSLGTDTSLERAAKSLTRLGLDVSDDGRSTLTVRADNTRLDLNESCDLLEEIARIEGFDNIPETMPIEPIPERKHHDAIAPREALRDALVGSGLQEILSYSLNGTEVEAKLFAGHPDAARPALVPVLNPVSADRAVLRSSLLPGLLHTAAMNLRHAPSVSLFELGVVFAPKADPRDVPNESNRVAIVLAGQVARATLHEQKPRSFDFFDLKAQVQSLCASLGISKELRFEPEAGVPFRPGAAARVFAGDVLLGTLGALHPRVLAAYDFADHAAFAADFALEALLAERVARRQFVDYDRLPSIELDIAAFVVKSVTAFALRSVARAAAGPWLREVEVFDEFHNPELGDKKSIAIRLRLNAGSRTLEMAEALEVRARVARAFEAEFSAKIRE